MKPFPKGGGLLGETARQLAGVRRRPVCQITLSVEARVRLDEMATRSGETRSGMVEKLVRETEMPRPKTWKKVETTTSISSDESNADRS